VPISEFEVRDPHRRLVEAIHRSPPNVLFMPMTEASSIARIGLAARDLGRRGELRFVGSDAFEEDGRPFISVGGPSVNGISAHVIEMRLPHFEINYPEASEAALGSRKFQIVLTADGQVCEDYGFILATQSGAARCLILWGILAFGTGIATEALLDLRRFDRRTAASLHRGGSRLLVVHGHVSGFRFHDLKLVANEQL
jgi:hypothetical protein